MHLRMDLFFLFTFTQYLLKWIEQWLRWKNRCVQMMVFLLKKKQKAHNSRKFRLIDWTLAIGRLSDWLLFWLFTSRITFSVHCSLNEDIIFDILSSRWHGMQNQLKLYTVWISIFILFEEISLFTRNSM